MIPFEWITHDVPSPMACRESFSAVFTRVSAFTFNPASASAGMGSWPRRCRCSSAGWSVQWNLPAHRRRQNFTIAVLAGTKGNAQEWKGRYIKISRFCLWRAPLSRHALVSEVFTVRRASPTAPASRVPLPLKTARRPRASGGNPRRGLGETWKFQIAELGNKLGNPKFN